MDFFGYPSNIRAPSSLQKSGWMKWFGRPGIYFTILINEQPKVRTKKMIAVAVTQCLVVDRSAE